MNIRYAVFAASIAANVGLCAMVLLRAPSSDSPHPALETSSAPGSPDEASPSGTIDVERDSTRRALDGAKVGAPDAELWASLHDSDPAVFEKNLRAAGLPEHVVSALLAAEARERMRSRQAAGGSSGGATRDSGDRTRNSSTAAGPDGMRFTAVSVPTRGPLSYTLDFIDPSRREPARVIARDYDTMLADLKRGGMLLTDAEKEMVATLESERHRDLEGILTPRELADFEILKSPLYSRLAHETELFKPTLDEFRAIFAMEKQYMDRFGTPSMSSLPPRPEERSAAEQFRTTADDQLLVTLGAERFAEYDRSRHLEYRELSKLVSRVNLPATEAVGVFALRDYVSVESNRIYDDPNLSLDQKRAALQTLATGVRTQVHHRLGNEAGAAYLQLAERWLTPVEQGGTVTFKSYNHTMYRRLPKAPVPRPGGG